MLHLALFQPDIPGNAGTMMRLASCLGVAVDVVEPAGFDLSDRNLRRAGLDYLDRLDLHRHVDFAAFERWRRGEGRRLVLATTHGADSIVEFRFEPSDVVMVGRESAGVPPEVHAAADARIVVPMRAGFRSLNVAVSAAMILGEALRQTGGFPEIGTNP